MDGKVIAHHAPCTPEQMGAETPANVAARKGQPPTLYNWVEDTWADANAGSFFKGISAYWTVPPAPITNGGIVYLFPSLTSDWGNPPEIIQPVLQFGNSGYFGGRYWVISSWYVYYNGAHHSPVLNVYPGDVIYGSVVWDHGTGSTAFYNIFTQNVTRGGSTTLSINTNGPFVHAQGGVLEVYGIQVCGQLPKGPASFTTIHLWDQNLTTINPYWFHDDYTAGYSPQCGFAQSSGQSGNYDYANLFFN